MKVKTQVFPKSASFSSLSHPSSRVTECSPCGPCMCLHSDVRYVYINVSVLHQRSGISASHQQNCPGILRWGWGSSCRIETEEERLFHTLIYSATLEASDAFLHQCFNGNSFFFFFNNLSLTFIDLPHISMLL